MDRVASGGHRSGHKCGHKAGFRENGQSPLDSVIDCCDNANGPPEGWPSG